MSTGTMSKKRMKHERPVETEPVAEVVCFHDGRPPEIIKPDNTEIPKPRITSYVAPPCSACSAMRPEGENHSRVMSTHGRIRYCKCGFCGNTFKDVVDTL